MRVNASTCSSSTRIERSTPLKLSGEQLFDSLRTQADVVNDIKEDVQKATVGNFSDVVFPSRYTHEVGRFQKCVVEHVTGMRVLSKEGRPLWYMLTGISNQNIAKTLPDWNRQFVSEFVGVDLKDDDFLAPLWQNVRPETSVDVTTPRQNFATVLELWAGSASFSGVYDMNPSHVPAVIRGIEDMSRDIDQATDGMCRLRYSSFASDFSSYHTA